MLQTIDEVSILREFKRIAEKEARAKERLKREQSSISPQERDGLMHAKTNIETNYLKKLGKTARTRQQDQKSKTLTQKGIDERFDESTSYQRDELSSEGEVA